MNLDAFQLLNRWQGAIENTARRAAGPTTISRLLLPLLYNRKWRHDTHELGIITEKAVRHNQECCMLINSQLSHPAHYYSTTTSTAFLICPIGQHVLDATHVKA
jgi:hypothetical protein